MNKTQVITYQSPNGERIDLTPRQVKQLRNKGSWPKDSKGQEYCQVHHGLHAITSSTRKLSTPTNP